VVIEKLTPQYKMIKKGFKMLKQIKYLIIGIFFLPLWANAQDTCVLKGFVFDNDTGLPLNDVYIECDMPKKSFITDASGRFRFDSLSIGKHKLRFIDTKGYYIKIDSTISPSHDSSHIIVTMRIKEEKYCLFYKEMAKINIQQGKIKLYVNKRRLDVDKNEIDFEEKYQIKYQANFDGCTISPEDCLRAYNNIIATYLTKTYGEGWKKEVRKDVIF
jgi:hypothetical protein